MSKPLNTLQVEQFRITNRQYSDATILMHEAVAKRAGLSGTDHKYLSLLIEKGQATAGELSKMTGLSTGAVTGLIDRLEKKNLARREFDKDDRRKIIIVPNIENTQKLLDPILAHLQKKTTKLITSFSKKKIEIIIEYFLEATEIMNDITGGINNKE
jgi:DNA-binding MarR family transcriptional regulator